MGKMCVRIIEEVKELKEVSLVMEPANKRARVIRITDDDGILRDVMTWQPAPESTDENTSNKELKDLNYDR
jgi:phage head maturation protease